MNIFPFPLDHLKILFDLTFFSWLEGWRRKKVPSLNTLISTMRSKIEATSILLFFFPVHGLNILGFFQKVWVTGNKAEETQMGLRWKPCKSMQRVMQRVLRTSSWDLRDTYCSWRHFMPLTHYKSELWIWIQVEFKLKQFLFPLEIMFDMIRWFMKQVISKPALFFS